MKIPLWKNIDSTCSDISDWIMQDEKSRNHIKLPSYNNCKASRSQHSDSSLFSLNFFHIVIALPKREERKTHDSPGQGKRKTHNTHAANANASSMRPALSSAEKYAWRVGIHNTNKLMRSQKQISASSCLPCLLSDKWGLVRIMSWYPESNGSHFGLPPSSIHKMTRLSDKMVWTMTYAHRPHWPRSIHRI